MTEKAQEPIERIIEKAAIITKRYIDLRQEKLKADALIEGLSTTIKQQQDEIERLRLENQYLKVVTTTDPKRESVEESRAILSELVREIDKCISELSEE